jgi:hypothetical protein
MGRGTARKAIANVGSLDLIPMVAGKMSGDAEGAALRANVSLLGMKNSVVRSKSLNL